MQCGKILARHHRMRMILQVAANGVVRVGQVAGGFRQVDRRLAGVLRLLAVVDSLDQLAKIVGDIVDSLDEFRPGSERRVEFPGLPGFGIDLEKLVAQHGPKLRRKFFQRQGSLENFKHPRPVADPDAGGQFRRLPEPGQFPQGPFRVQIARRQHGHERRGLPQPVHQRIREEVIALELGILKDRRVLSQKISDADFQDAVKLRDPPQLALDQGLIVEVGIANERLVFESHKIPGERGRTSPV